MGCKVVAIKDRIMSERRHFNSVYEASLKKEPLKIPVSVINRYIECKDSKVYGKECLFFLAKPLNGVDVLEVGCGSGTDSILLASNGARVFAYDVSDKAIELAKLKAEVNGFDNKIEFAVASDIVEAFPGRRFDLVFCNAVLHHLEIEGLADKIRRVLKPSGRCVFREPVVLSNAMMALRKLISWYPSNPTPDERPLTIEDIQYLTKGFKNVEVYYFEGISRIWYLIKGNRLRDILHRIDSKLFEFSLARRFASVVVVRMEAR